MGGGNQRRKKQENQFPIATCDADGDSESGRPSQTDKHKQALVVRCRLVLGAWIGKPCIFNSNPFSLCDIVQIKYNF